MSTETEMADIPKQELKEWRARILKTTERGTKKQKKTEIAELLRLDKITTYRNRNDRYTEKGISELQRQEWQIYQDRNRRNAGDRNRRTTETGMKELIRDRNDAATGT